jgi:hypothetical protein
MITCRADLGASYPRVKGVVRPLNSAIFSHFALLGALSQTHIARLFLRKQITYFVSTS